MSGFSNICPTVLQNPATWSSFEITSDYKSSPYNINVEGSEFFSGALQITTGDVIRQITPHGQTPVLYYHQFQGVLFSSDNEIKEVTSFRGKALSLPGAFVHPCSIENVNIMRFANEAQKIQSELKDIKLSTNNILCLLLQRNFLTSLFSPSGSMFKEMKCSPDVDEKEYKTQITAINKIKNNKELMFHDETSAYKELYRYLFSKFCHTGKKSMWTLILLSIKHQDFACIMSPAGIFVKAGYDIKKIPDLCISFYHFPAVKSNVIGSARGNPTFITSSSPAALVESYYLVKALMIDQAHAIHHWFYTFASAYLFIKDKTKVSFVHGEVSGKLETSDIVHAASKAMLHAARLEFLSAMQKTGELKLDDPNQKSILEIYKHAKSGDDSDIVRIAHRGSLLMDPKQFHKDVLENMQEYLSVIQKAIQYIGYDITTIDKDKKYDEKQPIEIRIWYTGTTKPTDNENLALGITSLSPSHMVPEDLMMAYETASETPSEENLKSFLTVLQNYGKDKKYAKAVTTMEAKLKKETAKQNVDIKIMNGINTIAKEMSKSRKSRLAKGQSAPANLRIPNFIDRPPSMHMMGQNVLEWSQTLMNELHSLGVSKAAVNCAQQLFVANATVSTTDAKHIVHVVRYLPGCPFFFGQIHEREAAAREGVNPSVLDESLRDLYAGVALDPVHMYDLTSIISVATDPGSDPMASQSMDVDKSIRMAVEYENGRMTGFKELFSRLFPSSESEITAIASKRKSLVQFSFLVKALWDQSQKTKQVPSRWVMIYITYLWCFYVRHRFAVGTLP